MRRLLVLLPILAVAACSAGSNQASTPPSPATPGSTGTTVVPGDHSTTAADAAATRREQTGTPRSGE